jgi:hypothetical protein
MVFAYPAGKTGRDHEVGDSSVAVASFEGAAVDPLREALAALDDRDYATAQRLFAAIGRKDVAEAIKDALAALDRKDYATAQGLFEALGEKGAAAAQVKGSAPASPAPPKPAASAGGPMASDSQNKARQKPVTSPLEVIPLADAAYRRPLPQAERAKSRRLKPLLAGTGLVLFAIFGVSAIYGSPLNWTFPTKSQAIAGLSSAADVLKADLEAITGQSAREEERSAAKPEVAGALVDPTAAARVDEDLDYMIAQRKGSVEGWRSFLAAHGSGVHAQSAKAEVEKLLLAGQDPAPAAAEVSNGASTDAKAVSEVVPSAPPPPATEAAALAAPAQAAAEVSNGASTDAKAVSEVVPSAPPPPATEAAALAAPAQAAAEVSNGASTDAKAVSEVVPSAPPPPATEAAALAAPAQAAAEVSNGASTDAKTMTVPSAPPPPATEAAALAAPAQAAAPPIPPVKDGSAVGPKWQATVPPVRTGWTASTRSLQPRRHANGCAFKSACFWRTATLPPILLALIGARPKNSSAFRHTLAHERSNDLRGR